MHIKLNVWLSYFSTVKLREILQQKEYMWFIFAYPKNSLRFSV